VCGSRRVCSLQIVPAPMNHMVRPVTLPSGSTDQVSAPDPPPPPHSIHVLYTFIHFSTANLFLCPSLRQPSCEFHLPNLYPVLFPTDLQFKFFEKITQDEKVLANYSTTAFDTKPHFKFGPSQSQI
jgi:hypothetical protein